uniref:semaphorin-4D-like n=1 Tax=Myxine glutinosa TaxID=7769 RepID=UPI0035900C45
MKWHPMLEYQHRAAVLWLLCFLALLLAELEKKDIEPVLKIFTTKDLQAVGVLIFTRNDTLNCSSLLLLEESEKLYLGAREIVFALNASNVTQELGKVNWSSTTKEKQLCGLKSQSKKKCHNFIRMLHVNGSHLLVCGTNSFNPQCAQIDIETFTLIPDSVMDGRRRCPFNPNESFASILIDDEVYSATTMDFHGTKPIIYRSFGSRLTISTMENKRWLNEPSFVRTVRKPRGSNGQNQSTDEILFFFSETAREFSSVQNLQVPRVARVCTEDIGGLRVLQKKWTSFVKSRLECRNGPQALPFGLLKDVAMSVSNSINNTTFYALFHTQWDELKYSAVCAYSQKDIEAAFVGRFFKFSPTDKNEEQLPVRPGTCLTPELRQKGYTSSQEIPDESLRFLQDNPLLTTVIRPSRDRPLLMMTHTRYTCIAVEPSSPLAPQPYTLLYLGTETGELHKAVSIDGEMHIISSMKLFPGMGINVLAYSSKKGLMYASSVLGVAQVPVVYCAVYRNCCHCLAARDPHCGWNLETKCCETMQYSKSDQLQDLKSGCMLKCQEVDPPNPEILRTFYKRKLGALAATCLFIVFLSLLLLWNWIRVCEARIRQTAVAAREEHSREEAISLE